MSPARRPRRGDGRSTRQNPSNEVTRPESKETFTTVPTRPPYSPHTLDVRDRPPCDPKNLSPHTDGPLMTTVTVDVSVCLWVVPSVVTPGKYPPYPTFNVQGRSGVSFTGRRGLVRLDFGPGPHVSLRADPTGWTNPVSFVKRFPLVEGDVHCAGGGFGSPRPRG